MASEVVKAQLNRGKRKELYYFRDRPGLEVDFLVPRGDRHLVLMEAKASKTVRPSDGLSMVRLQKNMRRYRTSAYVVHLPSPSLEAMSVVGAGVQGISHLKIPEALYPQG